ncbi:hypothetical protein GCM10009808_25060 [Microbacterium sediminicola]|uniref:HTH marR-type domain-containing protein n=1 Tax=Microbacterium sediminicola TaxID=415210 RepID=A0ABP4UJ57_9MICO
MDGLNIQERTAVARLRALLELLPSALDKELAPAGITFFEYAVLESLAESENHRMRLSALASRTNATLPRLSRVITGLERKDYVLRAPCEADGRATNAVLTDAGGAALEGALPLYTSAVRSKMLDGLEPETVDSLAELSLELLRRLDPDKRMAVTADGPACAADPIDAH